MGFVHHPGTIGVRSLDPLGVDPARGKTVARSLKLGEAETGARLEAALGRRFIRDFSGDGDWISGGKVYDAASPPMTEHFKVDEWFNSVENHFLKTNLDVIVVDTAGRNLSFKQLQEIGQSINSLPAEQRSRVLVLTGDD